MLWLQNFGIRKLEAFILSLVAVIGISFFAELFFAKPDIHQIAAGFIPGILNKNALYIAVGIIGATVMPHNLYLHSALVQTRKIKSDKEGIKNALRFNMIDSTIALNAAFFVNAAILILAASVFFSSGNTQVAKIEDAHKLLAPLLGSKLAPVLFAIALIAAGQSSTITGTLAGQIVMEGYLQLRINPLLRRFITRIIAITPAIITILIYGNEKIDALLVLSQVILSIQLGFAVIPLIHFVSDKATMGEFAIKNRTKIAAWLVAGILVFLNVKMVLDQSIDFFNQPGNIVWKILILLGAAIFIWLFIMMTFLPIFKKRKLRDIARMHNDIPILQNLAVNANRVIAISLDFSKADEKLIAYAIAQGQSDVRYILIHIVESPSAKYFGEASDDYETRKDMERLEALSSQLIHAGYKVEFVLGYRNRVAEIVRIVKMKEADMLVMGAHRHRGIKDYIFGETIESVRHQLEIPVLIVNV